MANKIKMAKAGRASAEGGTKITETESLGMSADTPSRDLFLFWTSTLIAINYLPKPESC